MAGNNKLKRPAMNVGGNFLAGRLAQATELHVRGQLHQAEGIYTEILSIDARNISALHQLGVVMIQTQRLERGLELFDKALALKPDFADALNNRGIALKELRRFGEAVASYEKALAFKPDYAEALSNRGVALQELKRLDEALRSFDKALAIRPNYVDALNNRGAVLRELDRLDEALTCFDKALAFKPDDPNILGNRGLALIEMRRLDEAARFCGMALAIKPDDVMLNYNSACLALLSGDLSSGWRRYEWRLERPESPHWSFRARVRCWRGEPLFGKRILVYGEQGFGDIIQFVRYLQPLVDMGAHVTFLVRPEVVQLLRSQTPAVRLLTAEPADEDFDYQSALLSLPVGFATTLETIPAQTPYLRAQFERVRIWKDRLGESGFKIGIAWRGSKLGAEIGKSFALAEFFGVSRLPNVRLISLQKHEGAEQLGELPEGMRVETLGDDFDAGEDAFLDTAAVMENLDLVISTDTSIAHLAGALGRPVWVALKQVPDWRWLMDRSDTPWYPTMRLFRQQCRGHWKGVFADVEAALRGLMESSENSPKDVR